MTKRKEPVTAAIRALRAAKVKFQGHPYDYVEGGGTHQFALQTGIDEHAVVKTLVMEDDAANPLIVLMHGDREVSTRALARTLGVKSVHPCDSNTAERYSGYNVGGTSPFGMRCDTPVYCEAGVADLPMIYINGGKRGYIISMRTEDMLALLKPALVRVAR